MKHRNVPQQKVYHLFLNHFLFTWSARSYEFSATLFVASAFPESLAAASWIGISTSLAVIVFASSLGRWVDHAPDRFDTLLKTISVNRLVIFLACICWAFIFHIREMVEMRESSLDSSSLKIHSIPASSWKNALFVMVLGLGVVERLSRLSNLLSIERDWVPTLAIPEDDGEQSAEWDLSHLNAVMSRIDLICKLIAPVVMSGFMSATNSPRLTAAVLAFLNLVTWMLERWTALAVWCANQRLQTYRHDSLTSGDSARNIDLSECTGASKILAQVFQKFLEAYSWCIQYALSLQQYFSTEVWIPSVAMSSLHFSVLAFSGVLTVFLVQSGFSITLIMWGELLSAIFELSSTFVFSFGIRKFSPLRSPYIPLSEQSRSTSSIPEISMEDNEQGESVDSKDQTIGVSRLGFWALTQTSVSLAPVIPAIWQLSQLKATGQAVDSIPAAEKPASAWTAHPFIVISVLLFISASRLGRWTNVLATQQLAQSCVHPDQRSTFAGTEASLSSLFGLGHWLVTAIWSKHEDFKWAAVASLGIVVGSTTLYCYWLLRKGRTCATLS